MAAIAKEAQEFLEAHRVMPYRAQTVMYKLLRYYVEYCCGVVDCLIAKCFGAGEEAKEMFQSFFDSFGRHEHEIATCFDHFLAGEALNGRIFKRPENLGYEV